MARPGTHAINVEAIRRLMADNNITGADLAEHVRVDRKTIANYLEKVTQPSENNLVLLAQRLGVKWRTLLESHAGVPEPVPVSARNVLIVTIDLSKKDMTEEEMIARITAKLVGRLKDAEELVFRLIRNRSDKSENSDED